MPTNLSAASVHVIPKGFVRVRHFGFLANSSKGLLSKCRQLLALNPALPKLPQKSVHELMLQLTGIDITRCPLCQKGTLVFFANLPVPAPWDSSYDCSTTHDPCLCRLSVPEPSVSVRPVLSLHPFLPRFSIVLPTRSRPIVASKTARPCQNQLRCYVCSARCPRYNPHIQPLLLHPTL